MNKPDGELVREVALALEIDLVYTAICRKDDQDSIDAIRACGRAAGRYMRRHVRTRLLPGRRTGDVKVEVLLKDATQEELHRALERLRFEATLALEKLRNGQFPS